MNAELQPTFYKPHARVNNVCGMLVGGGAALFLIGVFCDATEGHKESWANWLLGSYMFMGIALFGAFFLALNNMTKSGWHIVYKRVFEAMTAYLPFAFAAMLILIFGMEHLYHWMHVAEGDPHKEVIDKKIGYLNQSFFIIRMFAYFSIWIFFAWKLKTNSRKQDMDGNVEHTHRNVRFSALFMVLFALTLSAASYDFVMSLDAAWFSTMFGPYHFAGMFQAGIAATIILVWALNKMGYMRDVLNANHIHGLGLWLFALSVFWCYLWFSQMMLIWYANMPEETQYFLLRSPADKSDYGWSWWWVEFVITPALRFGLPFLILMPKPNKRNMKVLVPMAFLILAGHWVDLWVGILPTIGGHEGEHVPHFGLCEIGAPLFFAGVFGLVFFKALAKAPLIPTKDPYLQESLHQQKCW